MSDLEMTIKCLIIFLILSVVSKMWSKYQMKKQEQRFWREIEEHERKNRID